MTSKTNRELDRRSFLKGSLAVGAIAAGSTLAACAPAAESTPDTGGDNQAAVPEWQLTADVVVIGSGFAGLTAAITAADAGSSVILIEKAAKAEAGGNSRVCAQAVWTPSEVDATVSYFKELAGDYHLTDLPDAVARAYISEASHNAEWLTDVAGLEMMVVDSSEYPNAPSAPVAKTACMGISKAGLGYEVIWKAVMAAAEERPIEFLYETALTDLVFDADGQVIGVLAAGQAIKASQGVVICSGGFENEMAMNANYLRYPALTWGTPMNTGDGHKICMKYDIDFWHMNSATPGTRVGLKMPGIDPKFANVGLDIEFTTSNAYYWADMYGQRFMDEKREYQHGYARDAVFYNDSIKMEWPRLPFWQVFDESGLAELVGRDRCGWLEVVAGITLSEGLATEIAAGVVFKADSPAELAEQAGIDVDGFVQAFERFNSQATAGEDADFDREAAKMAPLAPPYYLAQVYPVMVNTNGGPRRNDQGQIMKTDGTPVPRLYSAGEFGSVWAWYYQGAGNVSECFAFGRISGRNASALTRWDA